MQLPESKNFQSSSIPMARSQAWFWLWIVAVTLLRLVLCSQEEVGTIYAPHDDFWHIAAAKSWFWGSDYHRETLYHLPLYSLFIRLVSLTGIPLRLVMDLLFSLSVGFFGRSLRRIGFGWITVSIAALVGILHPATFERFNSIGAENLLVPGMLAALAASLCWWSVRGKKSEWPTAWLAAFLWAVNWNLRKESILILALLGIFAGCIVLSEKTWNLRSLARRLTAGIVLPIALSVACSFLFKTANYLRWGVFETSIITSKGYLAAFRALQSIPPHPHVDFIPATVEVRERAYAVSPSFATLRPYLEGPGATGWRGYSKEFTDSQGLRNLDPREIAAGWFYWALHDAVVETGHGKTARDELEFFQQIGNEITSAQKQGRLEKRIVWVAYIDPVFTAWARRLPASLRAVIATTLSTKWSDHRGEDSQSAKMVGRDFDEIANRRAYLIEILRPHSIHLIGWAKVKNDDLISMELVSKKAVFPSQFTLLEKTAGGADFFNLQTTECPFDEPNPLIRFHYRDAGPIDVPLGNLAVKAPARFKSGSRELVAKLLEVSNPMPAGCWQWAVQDHWRLGYMKTLRIVIWSGLFLVPLLVLAIIRRQMNDRLLLIFFLVFVVFERIAFFSVLDASSWPGAQMRYLAAIMPLQAMLVVLILAESIATISGWRKFSFKFQRNRAPIQP